MTLVIALLVALAVIYLVYRQMNKVTDEAFESKEVEKVTPVVEEVVAEPMVDALVEEKPKKTRKKAAGGKKSAKKIKSVEE